jgi:hypothetical protein
MKKVLELGEQTLTGVFPKSIDQTITRGPLTLLKCDGDGDSCGLLQLANSYDLSEMYGDNYGYRSGLNPSMVKHLHAKVDRILGIVDLSDNPIILDIGSNDGTTLSAYPADRCRRIGIDPTADKYRSYYDEGTLVVADFFSARVFRECYPEQNARVITSFSMFYDLEKPLEFVREVSDILDENGVWVFEQSYMPTMLERNSYDTVCHEHLEYYGLKQILWMLAKYNLKIVDIEFNDINGGSFSVTAAKMASGFKEYPELKNLLLQEDRLGLNTLGPYLAFAERVVQSRDVLCSFIQDAFNQGKRVACLGASTKGNVVLQYCGLSALEIEAVGEVNSDKYGAFTPGSLIPIVDETELIASEPDFLIVLPWHFRAFFLEKYQSIKSRLVFPLPELEIH